MEEEIIKEAATFASSEFQGGHLTSAIRSMVGVPPVGFEWVEYAVGASFFIILFALVASVFVGFSKVLGAR